MLERLAVLLQTRIISLSFKADDKQEIGAFLRNLDPRPPYLEAPNSRTLLDGCAALLLIPALIGYVVLGITPVHRLLCAGTVCTREKHCRFRRIAVVL